MSKLYDVISRLDEMSALEEVEAKKPDIPFQNAPDKTSGLSAPMRILIICGILVILGLVTVGITAWWQDWFNLRQVTTPPPTISSAEKVVEIVAPKSSMPVEEVESSLHSTVSAAFAMSPSAIYHKQPMLDDGPSLTGKEPNSIKLRHLIVADVFSAPPKVSPQASPLADQPEQPEEKIQPYPVSLNVASYGSEKKIARTQQVNRWLYQAEQHRRSGDWQGAAILFARVWQNSENPSVANNLAASLIQLGRLEEASEILKKGLLQAPNDQDLQQNLQIVQDILAQ